MTDPGDADPESAPGIADRDASTPAPDGIADALRSARPEPTDVAAALSRARVAAALFGARDVVRIGRYEVEARAGAGGGGEVFVARDPELSRKVAIKLVRGGGDRERLLAEGQALARLSHPNIVPVYDAGTFGDRVYVVMELVEGDTLRAYCESAARSGRDIIRAYRQAAEGLAAAHRAGFIHRDFKPDNVLVGRDGRVRVVDFGLARGGDGDAPDRGHDGVPGSPISVTRAGLGTPRYMAPEQAARELLTPAVDQYAFCASLREGMLARSPGVPRWLDAVLCRGMAADPAARFPSMAAVHAALGRDPAWRWRRRGAAAAVLGIAAAAFVIGRGDRGARPACDAGEAELAAIWNPALAAQTSAALTGLVTPYAPDARAQIMSMLDGYAARWRAGHRDACVAHRDGAQSAALFDRRGACLSRARAALGAGVAVARTAAADQLAKVIDALAALPDLDRCADVEALTTPVAPPAAPIASAAAAVANQLASLEVEVGAARPGVRPRIAEVVTTARALGYPPLIARALRLAGVAAIDVDARADAVPLLAEATGIALTAHDMPLAVETFARRMYAAATIDPANATAGVELIDSIAAGLPPSERASRVVLDNAVGVAAIAAGQPDRARPALERALAMARELSGPARLEAAGVWTNLALVIDDPARRSALARERIATVESGKGASHPLVLEARISSAGFESDPRNARAALGPPCDQLADLHREHGYRILGCQYELGWLAVERADDAAARRAFTRAVASAQTGGRGPRLAVARAQLERLDGRPEPAARQLTAVLDQLGQLDKVAWWELVDAADAMLARGEIARRAGRLAAARADFEAARRALETAIAKSKNDAPRFARRRALAQASLVRASRERPMPPELRGFAAAAIAWYRSAGGYDDVIAELEPVLAP